MRKVTLVSALVVLLFAQNALAQKPAPGKPGNKPMPAAPAPPEPPPPPAPPPGPPPLSEALTGPAKADYESGKLLFVDGDYAGSLVKFSAAYDASKEPRLLWNMAAAEKNLRHYAKALRLVRQYAKDGDKLLNDADKKEAEDLIKNMEPFTAKLQLNIDEPGSEVSIDDEVIGPSPVDPVLVDIGTRKLRVRKEGFEEVTKDVPVGGAAQVSLDVKMVKIVHEGRLNVNASNNGTIAIDDKVVGTGTWSGVLPSGGHTLKVTAPNMRVYQAEVLIQDKQQREVAVTLEKEPSKGLPAWAWITGGVVLTGGLAVGGYFVFKQDPKYEGPPGNLSPGLVQASSPIRFH